MSSYELLELIEFMDEDGAFMTAFRGGEYSEARLDIRHLTNEVAKLRATMHAVHGGQRYDPPLLLSRAEQIEEAEKAEAATERREGFFSFADREA
jgi:hypothetical protein